MVEQIMKNIIIKGSPGDIYPMWADFETFPRFMKNVIAVSRLDEQRSEWIVKAAMSKRLKWEARLTDLQRNRRIAWSTVSGDIKTSGQVTFHQLENNETQVTVHMQYVPWMGRLGAAIIRWLANPEKKVEEDLRRFKEHAETNVAASRR